MKSNILFLAALAVIAVFVLIRFIKNPGKFIFKVLLNAAIGFVALFVINYFGEAFNFAITVNAWTVLIAGFLGLPGVILLIILTLT